MAVLPLCDANGNWQEPPRKYAQQTTGKPVAWSAEPSRLYPSPGIAPGAQNVFASSLFILSLALPYDLGIRRTQGCRRVPECYKARHVISSHLNSAVIRYDLVSRNLIALYTPPYCVYPRCKLKKKQIKISSCQRPPSALVIKKRTVQSGGAWPTGAIRTRRQHSRQVFVFAAGRPRGCVVWV